MARPGLEGERARSVTPGAGRLRGRRPPSFMAREHGGDGVKGMKHSQSWPGTDDLALSRGPAPGCGQVAQPGRTRPTWYATTTTWARSLAPSLVIARAAWVFTVDGLR